jgi:putative peptide zinc metalloprotease protein
MTAPVHSPNWYRVAHLKPRLRAHARIHRQIFRGQLWYVLDDRASGRFHRFTPSAYALIALMDGRRTVQQIWDIAGAHESGKALTQDDVIRLLAQLHQGDMLQTDITPDAEQVSRHATILRRRQRIMSLVNPMAIRISLFDPDEFLNGTMPFVRPLFTTLGGLAVAGVIAYGVLLAGMHWEELTHNLADRVLAVESLLLMLVTYPFVKALHELGHAYAVKRWGGEVHDIGIMFLVFMPVPYVDASASAAFRDKWRRALVGAAGIVVEMLLASLALMLWLESGEGLFRAFLFNVMFIGGTSTLLFNGNPLMRLDGYYVLSDVLEIPNLGVRSYRYLGYLMQRYAFGVTGAVSPVTVPSERPWMLLYATASFIYRIVIITAIVIFVASKYFVVGVIMAVWGAGLMILLPLVKGMRFLIASPAIKQKRSRAIAVTSAVVTGLAALLLAVPVPYATVVEGVTWLPGDSVVYAQVDGFAAQVLRAPGSTVKKGEPLIALEDPLLDANVRVLEAKTSGLRLRVVAASVSDQAQMKIYREELAYSEADLADLKRRRANLTILSPADGIFVLPNAADFVSKFVRKGQVIGYVARFDELSVRVIVVEDQADLVRRRTRKVDLRFAGNLDAVHAAQYQREVPLVSDRLPSAALSTVGGGEIYLDPSDPNRQRALAKLLQIEIKSEERTPALPGQRAWVRFDHGFEPLAFRMYFGVRQMFLRRFNV